MRSHERRHMRPNLRGVLALAAAFVTVLAAPTAQASTIVLDDFNRADSATLGAGWTQQAGQCSILSNQANCTTSAALATYVGGFGSVVGADVFVTGAGSTDYAALVLGYADDSNNLFIKLQHQDGVAGFDSIGFYFGNNGSNNAAWSGSTFLVGALPNFTSAYMQVSLLGTDLHLDIDSNFDTVFDYSFVRNNVPIGLLGTEIGIGGFLTSNLRLDNFGAGVAAAPEPASLLLLGSGIAVLAAKARRRRKQQVP